MKKKIWMIGAGAVLLVIAGIMIYNNVQVSVDKSKEENSFSAISGADGPTSIFIAGKLGDEDEAEDTSITIGGADGPTSIFLAGKLEDEDEAEDTSITIGGADGPTSIFVAGKLGDEGEAGYTSITMAEAKEIFVAAGDYIILDVRTEEEFAEGHIPGAVNVANEDIISNPPEELPDRNQIIFVYCRSGRRSKEAASKLAAMGYDHIIECGGILDWTGDVEK